MRFEGHQVVRCQVIQSIGEAETQAFSCRSQDEDVQVLLLEGEIAFDFDGATVSLNKSLSISPKSRCQSRRVSRSIGFQLVFQSLVTGHCWRTPHEVVVISGFSVRQLF